MKTLLFAIVLAVSHNSSLAQLQNAQQKDIRVHRVVLKKMNGDREQGYLYSLDDSGVTLAKWKNGQYDTFSQIPLVEIEKLKIRRKGSVLRGAVWGTLSGGIAGAVLGYTTGRSAYCKTYGGLFGGSFEICYDDTRGENAAGFAILLGILGGGTGAIIGTGNNKYRLNGQLENYNRFREQWQSFTIKNQTL